MDNSRRQFLFRIFAAAGMAATGRMFWVSSEEFVPELFTEGDESWFVLEPEDRLVLAMITPIVLDGVLTETLYGTRLLAYLKDFDYSLSLLSLTQIKEFKELLSLLKSLIGRVVIGGIWSTWNKVSPATVESMLQSWRSSYLDLIKVAYNGLKELSYGTWYGNPDNWQRIGYAGPPEIR
ncbi:MAG: hypothetical protein ACI9IA_002611 [Enterobacterales bacterium]|jgi:hypothetical protein